MTRDEIVRRLEDFVQLLVAEGAAEVEVGEVMSEVAEKIYYAVADHQAPHD